MSAWQCKHGFLTAIAWLVMTLAMWDQAFAQGGCQQPISQRTTESGCWVTAKEALGQLPQRPIFWHLDTYPTRAAAETAKGPRGTAPSPKPDGAPPAACAPRKLVRSP